MLLPEELWDGYEVRAHKTALNFDRRIAAYHGGRLMRENALSQAVYLTAAFGVTGLTGLASRCETHNRAPEAQP